MPFKIEANLGKWMQSCNTPQQQSKYDFLNAGSRNKQQENIPFAGEEVAVE